MELTHTLTATDRELIARAMDMAVRSEATNVDLCLVISRGLSPDNLDRDLSYVSALVALARNVGIDLASSTSCLFPFQNLGRALIEFTQALQGRGKIKYGEAFRSMSLAVHPEPGTNAYRVLMGTKA